MSTTNQKPNKYNNCGFLRILGTVVKIDVKDTVLSSSQIHHSLLFALEFMKREEPSSCKPPKRGKLMFMYAFPRELKVAQQTDSSQSV